MSKYLMHPPIAPNMPPKVEELFVWCHTQHCRLRREFRMSVQLFGSGPLPIHIISQAARGFFRDVLDAFYHDMQLTITRLTDSASTGKRDNICFESLIKRIRDDKHPDTSLSDRMTALLTLVNADVDPIRLHRDKMLAHNDLASLTSTTLQFLNPSISRLEAILARFDELINEVQVGYGGVKIPLDFFELGADAHSLLKLLSPTK